MEGGSNLPSHILMYTEKMLQPDNPTDASFIIFRLHFFKAAPLEI